jgi:hypothetical protein
MTTRRLLSMSERDVKLEDRGGAASMARVHDGRALVSDEESEPIDDQGTNQSEAAEILREIRDAAFDSSDEKLALALGRSSEEITGWLNGEEKVDSDALIKARALASERGVEHE